MNFSTPTELVYAVDRLSLFNRLETHDEEQTFPIRQLLWFITNDTIKDGKIFVDRWPNFRHICCLHSTKLYAPESDRDFVVVASSCGDRSDADSKSDLDRRSPSSTTTDRPPAVAEAIDTISIRDSLTDFIRFLVRRQDWTHRQGVVLFYINDEVVQIAQSLLLPSNHQTSKSITDSDSNQPPTNSNPSFWLSQPLRHFRACESRNLDEYERQRIESWSKIDQSLQVNRLQSSDAETVASNWHYDLPDKTAMFAWLIEILPTVCVREPRTGRPISWVMVYSCGASGAAFVRPEYRGRGLAEAQTHQLSVEMARICPSSRYFWILDENVASLKNAAKIYFDWTRTKLNVRILVINNNGGKNSKL